MHNCGSSSFVFATIILFVYLPLTLLTHWGRVTHICVVELVVIGSDNGLSPVRRQAVIWTNVGISLIGPLGTNFSEILIGIQTFSFKKLHLKTSSAKWRLFCLGLNELIRVLKLWWFTLSGYRQMYGNTKYRIYHKYRYDIFNVIITKQIPALVLMAQ